MLPNMRRRWVIIPSVLALLLVALYLGASGYLATEATKAERTEQERTPAELGLTYEEVTFSPLGEDFLLRGWYLPAEGARSAIVLVHGLDSNRGETDVGMLEIAQRLVEEGYTVLLFDLRAHGDSGGERMGAGQHEIDDLLGALDYLQQERDIPPERVGVVGFSFGGAITLLTAPHVALCGAVADSAFASISDLIVQEASDRTPAPEWAIRLLEPGMRWMASRFYDVDLNTIVPERAVKEVFYPLLLIHGQADARIPLSHGMRLVEAAPAGSTLWVVPEAEHARGFRAQPEEYLDRVTEYFADRRCQGGT